jgi:hypothetical protein
MRLSQSAIPVELHADLEADFPPAPKGRQRILIEGAETLRLFVTTFPFQRIVQ